MDETDSTSEKTAALEQDPSASASHIVPPKRVRRIVVDQLFGQYDYDLTAPEIPREGANVLILYGDNGSGKTTILKLLFHLLSASNKEGHRSALAKIPFRRFEVTLTDGTRISSG